MTMAVINNNYDRNEIERIIRKYNERNSKNSKRDQESEILSRWLAIESSISNHTG
jgi:hypothetical protein